MEEPTRGNRCTIVAEMAAIVLGRRLEGYPLACTHLRKHPTILQVKVINIFHAYRDVEVKESGIPFLPSSL